MCGGFVVLHPLIWVVMAPCVMMICGGMPNGTLMIKAVGTSRATAGVSCISGATACLTHQDMERGPRFARGGQQWVSCKGKATKLGAKVTTASPNARAWACAPQSSDQLRGVDWGLVCTWTWRDIRKPCDQCNSTTCVFGWTVPVCLLIGPAWLHVAVPVDVHTQVP